MPTVYIFENEIFSPITSLIISKYFKLTVTDEQVL